MPTSCFGFRSRQHRGTKYFGKLLSQGFRNWARQVVSFAKILAHERPGPFGNLVQRAKPANSPERIINPRREGWRLKSLSASFDQLDSAREYLWYRISGTARVYTAPNPAQRIQIVRVNQTRLLALACQRERAPLFCAPAKDRSYDWGEA